MVIATIELREEYTMKRIKGRYIKGRRADIRLTLDTDEIADILNISSGHVRRLILEGKLVFQGDNVESFMSLHNRLLGS